MGPRFTQREQCTSGILLQKCNIISFLTLFKIIQNLVFLFKENLKKIDTLLF